MGFEFWNLNTRGRPNNLFAFLGMVNLALMPFLLPVTVKDCIIVTCTLCYLLTVNMRTFLTPSNWNLKCWQFTLFIRYKVVNFDEVIIICPNATLLSYFTLQSRLSQFQPLQDQLIVNRGTFRCGLSVFCFEWNKK